MKLVLISSDDMIIGSTDLATEIDEYKFDYTGSYDSIYVYSYYPANSNSYGAYIYSIDNGVSGPVGPEDIEKTISVVYGENYRYFLTGDNIANVSAIKYTIVYNDDAITLRRIGENPVDWDMFNGKQIYYDSSIMNISADKNMLSFEVNKADKDWSGVLCPVEFWAKSTGNTTIQIQAEIKS